MGDSKKSNQAPDPATVPKAVVSRLGLYLRELQQLVRQGEETTSSSRLGSRLGVSDAQVRKDLAYFGQFGHPGIGYRCAELVTKIKRIVGTNQRWPVALLGVGNLGNALLGYGGFAQQGFEIVAAFDIEPSIVGTSVGDVPIFALEELSEQVARLHIRLGMITVPAQAAQAVADQLVQAGIVGIVNFAPVTISVPDNVSLVGVDLAIELEQITFSVVNRESPR